MAKKQMRYRLSVPKTSRHKTHILHEVSWNPVCGIRIPYWGAPPPIAIHPGHTLAAIDRKFMKVPNPCARCANFAYMNIK